MQIQEIEFIHSADWLGHVYVYDQSNILKVGTSFSGKTNGIFGGGLAT